MKAISNKVKTKRRLYSSIYQLCFHATKLTSERIVNWIYLLTPMTCRAAINEDIKKKL